MLRAINLVAAGTLCIVAQVAAQQHTPVAASPSDTLHIHAEKAVYKTGESILIVVDKQNVSKKSISFTLSGPSGAWYEMSVVGVVGPAEKTKELTDLINARQTEGFPSVINATILDTPQPGQTAHHQVPLTMYFVLKQGKYRVKFSEDANPRSPNV